MNRFGFFFWFREIKPPKTRDSHLINIRSVWNETMRFDVCFCCVHSNQDLPKTIFSCGSSLAKSEHSDFLANKWNWRWNQSQVECVICYTPLNVALFFRFWARVCQFNGSPCIDIIFFSVWTFLFRFLFELNYTLNICVFVVVVAAAAAFAEHYLELVWIFSRTHTILSVVCLFETFVYQFGASVVFVKCSLFIVACVCVLVYARSRSLFFSHTQLCLSIRPLILYW